MINLRASRGHPEGAKRDSSVSRGHSARPGVGIPCSLTTSISRPKHQFRGAHDVTRVGEFIGLNGLFPAGQWDVLTKLKEKSTGHDWLSGGWDGGTEKGVEGSE